MTSYLEILIFTGIMANDKYIGSMRADKIPSGFQLTLPPSPGKNISIDLTSPENANNVPGSIPYVGSSSPQGTQGSPSPIVNSTISEASQSSPPPSQVSVLPVQFCIFIASLTIYLIIDCYSNVGVSCEDDWSGCRPRVRTPCI
jgi:hypothetical protein